MRHVYRTAYPEYRRVRLPDVRARQTRKILTLSVIPEKAKVPFTKGDLEGF